MKSVSIVIPCFNYAAYVQTAIDSALNQTWGDVEVIVVDDGSTDGSAAVIASYGTRIQALWQPNQGHVAAFNRGYAASSGELVIFLDADDCLHPEAARCALQAWEPGCVKVQYALALIDKDGQSLGRNCCTFAAGYDRAAVAREFASTNTYTWPVSSGNVYARAFLQQVMPLTVRKAPDGLLNTLAPLFGEVITVDAALGSYRIHQTNQSYHGGGVLGVEQRFVGQIALRRAEERALHDVARARGQRLADVDLLDGELSFVNYRLMMCKLGVPYERSEADTARGLWWRGMRLVSRPGWPLRFRAQHFVWLCLLAVAPKPLARKLVLKRFSRDQKRKAGSPAAGQLQESP
jgi:hypothetical protein